MECRRQASSGPWRNHRGAGSGIGLQEPDHLPTGWGWGRGLQEVGGDPGAPGCCLLCPAWTPASKPDGGATCMLRSRAVLQGELMEFSPAPSPRASLILQAQRLPSHLWPHPLPCADRSRGVRRLGSWRALGRREARHQLISRPDEGGDTSGLFLGLLQVPPSACCWRGDLTAVSGPQRCKMMDQTVLGGLQTSTPYHEEGTLVVMGTQSEGRRVVGGAGGVSINLHLVLVTTRAQLLK